MHTHAQYLLSSFIVVRVTVNCQFDTDQSYLRGEASAEEFLGSECPLGMSVGDSLNY